MKDCAHVKEAGTCRKHQSLVSRLCVCVVLMTSDWSLEVYVKAGNPLVQRLGVEFSQVFVMRCQKNCAS